MQTDLSDIQIIEQPDGDVKVLLSYEEVQSLSRLEKLQDLIDMMDVIRARHEPSVKWEDVKKRLDKKHGIIE